MLPRKNNTRQKKKLEKTEQVREGRMHVLCIMYFFILSCMLSYMCTKYTAVYHMYVHFVVLGTSSRGE